MEDDDGDFLAAAREDDALVAKLLIRLSRSETCVAWRRLPVPRSKTPSETDVPAAPPLVPPTGTWGRRRARSAPVAAEGPHAAKREEEAGRASPATPLSWSGASGTSGSGSDDGCSTPPPRPPKRWRRREAVHDRGEPGHAPQPASKQVTESRQGAEEEQIGAPPAKGTTPEPSGGGGPAPTWAKVGSSDGDREPHGDSAVGAATAAVGSPAAGSGSSKGAAVAVAAAATRELGPTMSVAHAEPLRSRWAGEGASSAVFGRQGKKKTVLELRAMKDSLLREQEQLHKELGKQREVYVALLEENIALKKLESSMPSTTAGKQTPSTLVCVEAKSGEPQHMRPTSMWQGIATASVHDRESHEQPHCTSSPPPAPERTFLFDLNSLPDGDL